MEEVKATKMNYANALIRNTEDRSKEFLPVVTTFSIFHPPLMPFAGEFQSYGLAEIVLIAKFFSP